LIDSISVDDIVMVGQPLPEMNSHIYSAAMSADATARRFEGKAALVTGGGSGIGLGCAQRLAAEGAAITICGRSEERLQQGVGAIGQGARYVVADITSEAEVGAAVAAAKEATGGLDVVVANAGATEALGPLPLVDAGAFERDLRLNILGTFLTIKHSAPALAAAGGGAIVAVSSIAGVLTHRLMAPYSASKAGMEMLVKNAADELGAYGIRVNAIRPGLVPTDTSSPLASNDATREDYLAQMPLGRLGDVEDIAGAVAFLAGPDSTWITGQCIGVDGGHSLRRGPDLGGLVGGLFDQMLAGVMEP
jgi:NAD(P)-dependent dehydrogenase (short-subunit alcohol dehydrogenase family)